MTMIPRQWNERALFRHPKPGEPAREYLDKVLRFYGLGEAHANQIFAALITSDLEQKLATDLDRSEVSLEHDDTDTDS